MADKVDKEQSIARVYQFLNTHNNWKTEADTNGDGTIIKTEFRTYLLGSNFKWQKDENKNDIINAFWKSIDVNTKGSVNCASQISNQNAIDANELNKMDNNILALSVINDFIMENDIAAPTGANGIDEKYATKWKESVKAGILNQIIEYLKNYNEKFETKDDLRDYLGDKLDEFSARSSAKATADYKSLGLKDELAAEYKGTDVDYKPQSDEVLNGIIDSYISGNDIATKDSEQILDEINDIVKYYKWLADDDPSNDSEAINVLSQYDSTIGDDWNPLQEAVIKAKMTNVIMNELETKKKEFYQNYKTEVKAAIDSFVESKFPENDFNALLTALKNGSLIEEFNSTVAELEKDYNNLVTDRNKFYLEKVAVEWNKSDHNAERQATIKTFFGKEDIDAISKVIQGYTRAELDTAITEFEAAITALEAKIVADAEAEKVAAEQKYKDSFGNLSALMEGIMSENLSTMLCGYGSIHTEFGIDASGNIVFQNDGTRYTDSGDAKKVYEKVQETVKRELKLKDKEAYEAIGETNITKLIQAAWIMAYNNFNSSQSNSTAGFVQTVLINLESIFETLKENPDYLEVFSHTAYANSKLTSGLVHYGTDTTYGNDQIIYYGGGYTDVDGKLQRYEAGVTADADGTVHLNNPADDPDYQATMTALLRKIKKTEPYTKVDEAIITRVFQEAQKQAIQTCIADTYDCPYGTGRNDCYVEDTTRDWGGGDSRSGDDYDITMKELVQLTLYYFDKLLYKELAS